ncbi:MAG TPA: hypothetical protein G4O02_11005 [Caldilineae bacterium]|nr:hypothetical protein [Caldilineae bacterium]
MEGKYRWLRILAVVSLILAAIVLLWGLWNGLSWQAKAGYEGLTAPGGVRLVLRLTLFFLPFAPALFFAVLLFMAASGLQLMLDTAERTQALVEDLQKQARGS